MKKKLLLSFVFCFVFFIIIQNGFSQMVYNKAATFNGSTSFIAVPSNAEINPTTAITVEAWIYPTFLSNEPAIYSNDYLSSTTLYVVSPTYKVGFRPKSASSNFVGKGIIPLNQWTHIAATYTSGLTSIYINGVFDTSTTAITGPIGINTDSATIGCNKFAGSYFNLFTGMIDNLRVWNIARTQADIQRDMYIPLTMRLPSGLYTGLSASYLFDGNALDWSGAVTNNGFERNITYTDFSQKPSVYCDYNNTLILDGTTAYIAGVNTSDYNATTGITLEAWIKRDTTGSAAVAQHIVNKSGAARWDFGLAILTFTNNVVLSMNNDSYYVTSPVSSVPLARWYHLAATYSQATGLMKLYINGDSVAGTIVPGNVAIFNNPDSLCIGGISLTTNAYMKFKGQIDGVRIWKDVARTQAQIKADMYRSRIQEGTNGSCEITFDTYTNIPFGPSGGWNVASPLRFNGSARITSEHRNLDAELTSPMLAANELGFYSTSDYTVSTKRFFIPDGGSITDSVFFSGQGVLTDFMAFVLINHTFIGDVRLTLVGPTGVSVLLTPSSVGNSLNDIMTIFNTYADSTINYYNYALPPFSPKIKPANPFTPFIGTARHGWWKMIFQDIDLLDIGYVSGWGVRLLSPTGTGNETKIPFKFDLAQNFPNPFNPVTNIKYQIAKDANVSIKIFDMLGREILTLVNEFKNPGFYEVNFDGSKFSSGIYFYKITAGDFIDVKKMTLVK